MNQYVNRKNLMRMITVIGALFAVLTFIATAMSGCLVFKMIRCFDTAHRALPKVEKAAQLYIEDSTRRKEQSTRE